MACCTAASSRRTASSRSTAVARFTTTTGRLGRRTRAAADIFHGRGLPHPAVAVQHQLAAGGLPGGAYPGDLAGAVREVVPLGEGGDLKGVGGTGHRFL